MDTSTLTREQYLSCYLQQADLASLQCVQDARESAPDDGDDAFARHSGLFTGMCAWMGSRDAVIWRLVDIRFSFPNSSAAAAYHRERLRQNAENNPSVLGAPPVGEACRVYGGTQPTPIPDITMTAYLYLFLVGPVLVKLFVAQSVELESGTLQPDTIAPIARRVEAIVADRVGKAE